MHSHHTPDSEQSMSLGKSLLSAIPIVGRFVNSQNKAEAFDQALSDTVSLGVQGLFMYDLPFKFTDVIPHQEDMSNHTAMEARMGAEMALRMWAGDVAGRGIYSITSKPVKMVIKAHSANIFSKETWSGIALELGQLIPLFGPYLGKQNWKESLKQGTRQNLEYMAMLTGGTIAMMLSPAGMDTDPESVSISMSLMMAGMTATMMTETLLQYGIKKSAACLSSFSIFKPSEERKQLLALDDPNVQIAFVV